MNAYRVLSAALFVVVLAVAAAPAPVRAQSDDLALFITKYGKPDRVTSTEHQVPRPAQVTKQLIYAPENVRAIFVPVPPGPALRWKLKEFRDLRTNRLLPPAEAGRRLARRIRR